MKEKTIELGKVRQGERFKLDGVEFVKLDCDEEATFVLTADTLPECCAFEDDDAEREDHNNFDRSLIQKIMERFWREQHSPIFKAIVERPIDLTSMDGMTTYPRPAPPLRTAKRASWRTQRPRAASRCRRSESRATPDWRSCASRTGSAYRTRLPRRETAGTSKSKS